MAELVIQNSNGNDVTTSLIVAEVFGKEHSKVVRDIESSHVQRVLMPPILALLPTLIVGTVNRQPMK